MKLSTLISLVTLASIAALADTPQNTSPLKYSNFPSESAIAAIEGNRRILHRDDFSTDTLHRIWGCSNPKTRIESGVLKSHSDGGPSGKLKVSVEPFANATLEFRFRLKTAQGFGFGFDDLTAKDVSHGGHLIGISIRKDRVIVNDVVTGIYNLSHYEKYKDKKITPELENLFERCRAELPFSFVLDRWYAVKVNIDGEQLDLYIDERKLIEFRSPGISHPRKNMYRFNVAKGNMEFDDVTLVSYLK